jgi:hypothetical protein
MSRQQETHLVVEGSGRSTSERGYTYLDIAHFQT